ncbi:MAG: caspase family protein [Pseudorhodoplanes sp.]|uniref:caspase family protein n=1 Tax=Pseudorhodoplanes sp. TaxID=1934341 RepID=UPI003D119BC6
MRAALLWVVLGVLSATFASSDIVSAQTCNNPNAIGVARTVEIDTTGGPGFGVEHFKFHDFLRSKEVVLTFDDGPWPTTIKVLQALEEHCTRATFFMIGKHAEYYPEIVRQVARGGHTIGSHTYSHADLSKKGVSIAQGKGEIEKGIQAIGQALGSKPAPFFRFVALKHPPELVSYLGQRNIGIFSTDLDSFDFRAKRASEVVETTMAKLRKFGKGIVLLHDYQTATSEAMPQLLSRLKAEGYKIVHMRAKGMAPAPVAQFQPRQPEAPPPAPQTALPQITPPSPPPATTPSPPQAVAPLPQHAHVAAPTRPVNAQARVERRVALVIGNSAYAHSASLPNPARDAESIAAALRQIGFTSVKTETNVTREALISALRAFQEEADRADWAIVYFAGHGMEINGVNFLLPVDAKLKRDRDAQDEAAPLDRVLSAIEGAKKLRLVILDACRDNPFVAQMQKSNATRSIGRGLARVEPEGGTLVAFAAKHGQVALDGDGDNSPFVISLLRHLGTPNVEINKLFRLVRDDVLNQTGRRQEPFVYGSLPSDDFFFVQK